MSGGPGIILEDLSSIHTRLFNHRASLQGESSYFVKEFEEKRQNREEIMLQKTLEHTRESNEKLLNECCKLLERNLPTVNEKLLAAMKMSEQLINGESREADEWLQSQQALRSSEWAQFMDIMCEKSNAVDRETDEEVRRVKNYYREIEEKLQIT